MRRIAFSLSLASLGSAFDLPVALDIPDLSVIMVKFERLETDDIASNCENYDKDTFIRALLLSPAFLSLPGNCRLVKELGISREASCAAGLRIRSFWLISSILYFVSPSKVYTFG